MRSPAAKKPPIAGIIGVGLPSPGQPVEFRCLRPAEFLAAYVQVKSLKLAVPAGMPELMRSTARAPALNGLLFDYRNVKQVEIFRIRWTCCSLMG